MNACILHCIVKVNRNRIKGKFSVRDLFKVAIFLTQCLN